MTHSYSVSGMTCDGCVAKVKHKLLLHPDITDAQVSLDEKSATISMLRHLSIEELQKTIGDANYKIGADSDGYSQDTLSGPAVKSWFETYKPLLLIAAFLAGTSVLTSGQDIPTGMRHFMAGFFLVFSFFKLLDLRGFASSYAMYDVLAMKVPAYGFVYPFLELALGIAYLTDFNAGLTNWATMILMGFSSIGVIRSVLAKQNIRCACLGAVFRLPMSTVTIIEDLMMVVMAGAALI